MKTTAALLLILINSSLFSQDISENPELRDLYKETTCEEKKTEPGMSLEDAGQNIESKEAKKEGAPEEKRINPEEYLKYLKSDKPGERVYAIKIMGASRQKRYIKEIEPFLKDKNPLIVEAAIIAYGFSKDEASILKLRPMLKVPNSAMRSLVVKALYNIGGKKAEDLIIELLDDGDSSMRGKAAETLASMKSKAAWSRLSRSMCCDPSSGVRRGAAKALAEIQSIHSIKDLITGLKDSDKTVAFYCAVGLARMKDKSGIELLIDMLTYDEIGPRSLALDSLSYLEDRRLIEPLNKMSLNDKAPYLAKKAGEMLKKLEEKYKK
ncbi:MAG: HEAT repeat domain-containing protein [Candidatus Firestonebacteria bacterium]